MFVQNILEEMKSKIKIPSNWFLFLALPGLLILFAIKARELDVLQHSGVVWSFLVSAMLVTISGTGDRKRVWRKANSFALCHTSLSILKSR
jgi:hypothetical protein